MCTTGQPQAWLGGFAQSYMERLFVANAYSTCLYMQTCTDTWRLNHRHIQTQKTYRQIWTHAETCTMHYITQCRHMSCCLHVIMNGRATKLKSCCGLFGLKTFGVCVIRCALLTCLSHHTLKSASNNIKANTFDKSHNPNPVNQCYSVKPEL